MNEENRKEDGLEREEAMAEEFSDTELSDSPEAEQEQKDQADSQDHAEDGDAGEEEQEGTKDPGCAGPWRNLTTSGRDLRRKSQPCLRSEPRTSLRGSCR